MDVEYVKGVYDEKGKELIRPLNDEEKEFLNSFYEEYYGTNFKHKGELLHKTKKERLELYGHNNARNRCLYNLKRAIGFLHELQDHIYNVESSNMKYGSMVDDDDDIKIGSSYSTNNSLYYYNLLSDSINESLDKFNFYVKNKDIVTDEMWEDMFDERLKSFIEKLDIEDDGYD